MRCEQITPYLPGFAGGDLRPDTAAIVADHVASCARCATEVARQGRVLTGLATLSGREVEAPPYLIDAVIESVGGRAGHRFFPILPVPPADLARALSEHRDTIASAAGTVLVAAGAAYALWRAVRGARRTREQPA
jgi:anti-sigma factor RsiW